MDIEIDDKFLDKLRPPTLKVLAKVMGVVVPPTGNTTESLIESIRGKNPQNPKYVPLDNTSIDVMTPPLLQRVLHAMGVPDGSDCPLSGVQRTKFLAKAVKKAVAEKVEETATATPPVTPKTKPQTPPATPKKIKKIKPRGDTTPPSNPQSSASASSASSLSEQVMEIIGRHNGKEEQNVFAKMAAITELLKLGAATE